MEKTEPHGEIPEGRAEPRGEEELVRGLNDIRLAVLGIVLTIGLSVGFGVPGSPFVRALAALGSVGLIVVVLRWEASRRRLMSAAHWLTGR